jgi:hypothetical protein
MKANLSVRRLLLAMLGVGAAGTAAGAAEPSSGLFARQFLDRGVEMSVPQMVYDPELQMMVDPVTKQPIYEKNNQMKFAKVTAGCATCPKYDE